MGKRGAAGKLLSGRPRRPSPRRTRRPAPGPRSLRSRQACHLGGALAGRLAGPRRGPAPAKAVWMNLGADRWRAGPGPDMPAPGPLACDGERPARMAPTAAPEAPAQAAEARQAHGAGHRCQPRERERKSPRRAAAEPADRPAPRAASRRQHAQGDVPLRLPGGPPRREPTRRAGAGRRLAVALAGGAGRQVRRAGKPPAWRAKRPSGTTPQAGRERQRLVGKAGTEACRHRRRPRCGMAWDIMSDGPEDFLRRSLLAVISHQVVLKTQAGRVGTIMPRDLATAF